MPDKDLFNVSELKEDGQFVTYVTSPTSPAILDILFQDAVGAGPSIVLSSSAGTYATLQEQSTAGFLFYDLDNMVMRGTIPDNLTVDVAGGSEIPQFTGVSVPHISPLVNVAYGDARTIVVNTTFSWTPSGNPDALVRIQTSTAGGFFLENSVTIECLVPDNATFNFPANEQAQLGSDFNGEPRILSTLVAGSVESGNTMLYVIRESFVAEN